MKSTTMAPSSRPGSTARRENPCAGFHLIEVAITMAVTMVILLGVMATITTASVTEMRSTESSSSQMLLSQTVEELKDNEFDNLITFNGQYVTSGTVRADISVSYLTLDLVRVQVRTSSTRFPEVTHEAVLLQANLE